MEETLVILHTPLVFTIMVGLVGKLILVGASVTGFFDGDNVEGA